MATVTGLTKDRMLAIEAASVVNGAVDPGTGHLILTTHDGTTIDAGYVWGTVVDASDEFKGIVELATDAEVSAGTDTTRAVTPASLAALRVKTLSATDYTNASPPTDYPDGESLMFLGDTSATTDGWAPHADRTIWGNLYTLKWSWGDTTQTWQNTGAGASELWIRSGYSGGWSSWKQIPSKPLTSSDVGLGNVNNTSDANKPVSSAQQTALNAKAPTSSPTLTGTVTVQGRQVITPDVVTLSSGHAAIDASLGNLFDISATASFTLDNPTNPTDGQVIHLRITQDGTGGRLITLGTAWNAGPNTGFTLSTVANKRDHLIAQYHAGSSKWDITGFQKGF